MRLHANARTCPNSRKLLVQRIEEEGWSLGPQVVGWRSEGEAGLHDRSSAPKRIPTAHPSRWSKRSPHCGTCG
jgi:hypothetical protein